MAHFYSRFPLLKKGTVLALPFPKTEQEHYLPSSHNFVVYVVIYFPFSLDLLLLFCFCYSPDNKLILSLIDLYLLIDNLRDVTLLVESTLISIRWLSYNSIEHIWEALIRTWSVWIFLLSKSLEVVLWRSTMNWIFFYHENIWRIILKKIL